MGCLGAAASSTRKGRYFGGVSDLKDRETKLADSMELAALATAAIDGLRLLSVKPGRGAGVKGTSCWATDDAGNEWQIYAPNKRLSPAQLNAMLRGQHQLALARQNRTLPFSVPRVEGIVNRKDGSLVFVFPALGGEEAGKLRLSRARCSRTRWGGRWLRCTQ